MRLGGAVVVVTGAAQGIGAALCERFRREGARAVIGADINPANGAACAAMSAGRPISSG